MQDCDAMIKYTVQECDFIRKNYFTMTMNEIGVALGGRSGSTITSKANSLGLKHKQKITSKNIASYRAYSSWSAMLHRCYDPTRESWTHYGGRGISVCDEWRGNFMQFLGDMGERPVGYSIDRIDPNGNYEKLNCRWIPSSEQSRTTRRFLGIKPCIDCKIERGNRRGRCHKCNEYFRRHLAGRPPVKNVASSKKIIAVCPNCARVAWISPKYKTCKRCLHAAYERTRRNPEKFPKVDPLNNSMPAKLRDGFTYEVAK